MNRYATSGPVLVIPAREALLLERLLGVSEVRKRIYGQDFELDQVLLGWRAVAAQYEAEVADQRSFRSNGNVEPPVRKKADRWGTEEVASRAGCTPRTVRLAASEGRLAGSQLDGRWQFKPDDAAAWIAARNKE